MSPSHNENIANQLERVQLKLDETEILSKIGSWEWDIQKNEVKWSKNMYRIMGWQPFEIEPTYELVLQNIHDADRTRYKRLMNEGVQNKSSYYFECRNKRKGGEIFPAICSGKCLVDDAGNLIAMMGTVQDVSFQKELERIREEKAISEESNNLKSLILEVIAHDIRSPFNHLTGFNTILIDNIRSRDLTGALMAANHIKDASDTILKVLDSLKEWALTDSNRLAFRPEKINFSELANKIIGLFEHSAGVKNVTIENLVSRESYVKADTNMLITIIRNLITNALKFSKAEGTITLDFKKGEEETTISISDTGVGIKPQIAEKLFSGDELVTTYGTNKEKGHGLGLQICKTLVEKHGGKIWLESEVGKGTTCYFTISDKVANQG